ncbi:hydroxymethylpyrimidine kinase /phosphomethylpyrimidine kinase [Sulfurivirga caldicuralii]|uniref:hydroxymethylpyrimidine kinase n=1 Tax=Sulfurivirga caldicuralii TaxID=364032 RepID=A0A1N6DE29_9GAMM|nr:bifunctional hydroxymethylpyrimidine kinase/phosphomethylpyrimidine kinase [Sulfurivirga caldicuralii]SIN68904.1 hydroxymethylpyrimidine kinase /phosphomethylpyrimidine kinase [Sulfurivirga caldicuralii]
MNTSPVILTLAGFDPSGGAGLLADIKTIHALGGYGTGVITAQTVQNTCHVRATRMEPPELITAQIAALMEDTPPAAVKIGMLGSAAVTDAITAALKDWQGPLVLDPVIASSSGHPLYHDPLSTLLPLLRRATLITPNHAEAEQLAQALDCEPQDLPTALGCAVLRTGGDLAGGTLTDELLMPEGWQQTFTHPRVDTPNTHGTGCTLSSAIATLLAQKKPLEAAVAEAIAWMQQRLAASTWQIGHGRGPIRHL